MDDRRKTPREEQRLKHKERIIKSCVETLKARMINDLKYKR